MNTCIRFAPSPQPSRLESLYYGRINSHDSDGHWLIDGQFPAHTAPSLLVAPCIGDVVAYVEVEQRYVILHVLERQQQADDALTIAAQQPLRIEAPNIELMGWNQLSFTSLQRISMAGQHASISVSGSWVQQAEHCIQHAGHLTQTTSGIARCSAQQYIMTAEDDVCIDGKRINMG
ncbi:hypothetical protein CHH28_14655 [Bacterioplanes sanyensis]|uniref:DUF3540 domain-containing protein n=1 Tax=Bacterioplanes sanyensis TaxID=1249553 RepID=A0A222FLD3_9GAMM|nr:DUF3540 domain-containing protein [Bacterioplanes sanyensis]ASP39837.1 hypothetical protein CHH28_14655 [Bacterioplanes sanyensis]